MNNDQTHFHIQNAAFSSRMSTRNAPIAVQYPAEIKWTVEVVLFSINFAQKPY